MEGSSKIDFLITSRALVQKTKVVRMQTSDHSVISVDITQEGQSRMDMLTPIRIGNKEMFFSGLLNRIKEEHLRPYLRFLL